jgi:hypothetical protein
MIKDNSVTEGFGSQPLNPRNTLFILQNLDRFWGIKSSDFFTGTIGNKEEAEKKMMQKMIECAVNAFSEKFGGESA